MNRLHCVVVRITYGHMTYEEAVTSIAPGNYQHFKGNYYEMQHIARHLETTEPVVVYKALYGDGGIWVRPAEMWNEEIERDRVTYTRFHKLSAEGRITFYEQIGVCHAEKEADHCDRGRIKKDRPYAGAHEIDTNDSGLEKQTVGDRA